jgi:hypothetical protein
MIVRCKYFEESPENAEEELRTWLLASGDWCEEKHIQKSWEWLHWQGSND